MTHRIFFVAFLIVLLTGIPVFAQSTAEPKLLYATEVAIQADSMHMSVVAATSPDGSLVAWSGRLPDASGAKVEQVLHLMAAATGDELASLGMAYTTAVAFNQDGTQLAVALKGGSLLVIDVEVWRGLGQIADTAIMDAVVKGGLLRNAGLLDSLGAKNEILALAFNDDSSVVLLSALDFSTYKTETLFWDTRDPFDVKALADGGQPLPAKLLSFESELHFSPLFFTASGHGFQALSFVAEDKKMTYTRHTIAVDPAAGAARLADTGEPATFVAGFVIAQSDDGNTLVTAYGDGPELHLLNVETGTDLKLPLSTPLRGLGISHSGRVAVTISGSGQIQLWDTATGQPTHQVDAGHVLTPASIVFSPDDGRLILVARSTIAAWDLLPA